MKRFLTSVLASAFLFLGIQAFAQDIILKTDNSIIRANIEEINGDNVVYHNYDNPDGPIFKLPINQVQRIQFKNGTEQVFNTAPAASMYVNSAPAYSGFNLNQRLVRRGKNLYLGTYELNDEEIQQIIGQDLWEQTFVGARGQYNFANTMELVGDVFLILGLSGEVFCIINHNWSPYSTWYTTMFYSGLSAALTFYSIALPFSCIANGRMNWVVEESNHRRGLAFEPTLNMGLAPHGLGLTVNF